MKRVAWVVLLGLLSACGVYQLEAASVDRVELELAPEDLTVSVVAHGVLGNGCTRVGEVKQRREGRTFFVTIETIYDQPFGTGCTLAISEFREELTLDVAGLESGNYVVDVNGVVKTFTLLSGEWTPYEADILSVNVSLLESYPVQVVVTAEGYLINGCDELGDITQRRDENTFFVTILGLAPALPDDVACTPDAPPFTERVTLETQNLTPGTYEVDVNGVVESFTLP